MRRRSNCWSAGMAGWCWRLPGVGSVRRPTPTMSSRRPSSRSRKAASIRSGERLAGWLHRVATRIAAQALKQKKLRALREQSLGEREIGISPAMPTNDLAPVLDAEIDRLPDRLRRAVVHCYLEGRTTEEAASALGCPRGTVLSRLSAARTILQRRLERRGVAPAVLAGLAAAATQAVPNDLTAAAVRVRWPRFLPESCLFPMERSTPCSGTNIDGRSCWRCF